MLLKVLQGDELPYEDTRRKRKNVLESLMLP